MESIRLEWFRFLKNLPSLPSQMLSVFEELGRISAMDYNIARMIQYDPAIACRVLEVANNPLYGYPGKISSLQQASGLLGPGVIKNTILTTPLLERFAARDYLEGKIDYPRMWLHSSVTAAIAGCLGKILRHMESDVCFTAGLIHDIGKIALAVHHPGIFQEVLDLAEKEKTTLIEAEKKSTGFSHADIAVVMVSEWGFPPILIEALENCAKPTPPTSKLAALIQLSKSLAIDWGYPDGMETHFPRQYDALFLSLGISNENLATWKKELTEYADYVVHSCED